jgi:hypothetical protein
MKTPTADDLRNSIPHLAFEFYHFQFFGRLIQLEADGARPFVHPGYRQAVVYAFLMHLRALLDFFYSTKGYDDDILAADFATLPGFPLFGSEPPPWAEGLKTHLNKRLAHITSPRWKEDAPDLRYYHQHFPEIECLISSFRNALPPELKAPLSARIELWAGRDVALFDQLTRR